MIDQALCPPLHAPEQFLKYAHDNALSIREAYRQEVLRRLFGSERASAYEALTNDTVIQRFLGKLDLGQTDPLNESVNIRFGRMQRYSPIRPSRTGLLSVFYLAFGGCTAQIDSVPATLEKGDFLFVSPERCFSFDLNRDDCLLLFLAVKVHAFWGPFSVLTSAADGLSDYFSRVAHAQSPAPFLRIRTYDDPRPKTILEAIRRESETNDAYSSRMTEICFEWLMTELSRTHLSEQNAGSAGDSRAMQIVDYLSQNLKTATLSSAAAHFNYSASYTCRLISASTGASFSKLLTSLRMQRACALLRENALGIDHISEAVGYASISSFYRVFRRFYGCTPVEYRHTHTRARK